MDWAQYHVTHVLLVLTVQLPTHLRYLVPWAVTQLEEQCNVLHVAKIMNVLSVQHLQVPVLPIRLAMLVLDLVLSVLLVFGVMFKARVLLRVLLVITPSSETEFVFRVLPAPIVPQPPVLQ
jgi:hypothetical protein